MSDRPLLQRPLVIGHDGVLLTFGDLTSHSEDFRW